MAETPKAQARLYCILARDAPVAVIFRRGPNKRVLLLLWRTDTDQFYEGQWLKGRIYERRCDLSPNGTRLIYFAANYKQPYFSWTAVSRPPFLTALALWPKGDCWGGGGLFAGEHEILLNHGAHQIQLADGFALPRGFHISSPWAHAGWGEDSPIMDLRLSRDGWRNVQEGKQVDHGMSSSIWLEYDPAIVSARPHPLAGDRYELQLHLLGIKQREGPWYLIEHSLLDRRKGTTISLGKTDWADWCRSGDLLFAKEGKLFRLRYSERSGLSKFERARQLIDLTDHVFKEVPPPLAALQWHGTLGLDDYRTS